MAATLLPREPNRELYLPGQVGLTGRIEDSTTGHIILDTVVAAVVRMVEDIEGVDRESRFGTLADSEAFKNRRIQIPLQRAADVLVAPRIQVRIVGGPLHRAVLQR